MGRPRTKRTGDWNLIRKYILPIQELRFESLRDFTRIIATPESLEICKSDDRYFSTLLQLAFHDYRVPQNVLTKRLDLSDGVLGRWANMQNLPSVAAMRPLIIVEVAKMLSECIERELACIASGANQVVRGVYTA
jgi:hypothetical protein